jgi:hypothetical protein
LSGLHVPGASDRWHNETLKVIGFFSESEIISSFDEPVQPFGVAVLNQGAPAPVPA